jgi:hypothetical protein
VEVLLLAVNITDKLNKGSHFAGRVENLNKYVQWKNIWNLCWTITSTTWKLSGFLWNRSYFVKVLLLAGNITDKLNNGAPFAPRAHLYWALSRKERMKILLLVKCVIWTINKTWSAILQFDRSFRLYLQHLNFFSTIPKSLFCPWLSSSP